MPATAKGNGNSTKPARVAPVAKPPIVHQPSRFTCALKPWTTERRRDGWYVAPTTPSFVGNKPEWRGPLVSIETACLAIARSLAVELADRHTAQIE